MARLLACVLSLPTFEKSRAQEAYGLPDSPSAKITQTQQEQEKARREEAEREVKAEERQRIGGVVPNFNVVLGGHAVRLTPHQKLSLAMHTITDPYTIGLAVLGGGYGEVTDDYTGYGHGPGGYFKHVGAAYADSADGTLIGNALLPIVLHQDPRYFRKGTGSVPSRIVYSAFTTFLCHGDNGRRQFNTSNVLGNFIAGAISNAYYPADERGLGLTIFNATIVTLEGMIGAQLLEFSPDISERIQRRRQAIRDALAAKIASAQP